MSKKKAPVKKRPKKRDELTGEQKAFIVTALACYSTPLQVAKDFEDAFGIQLERQRVEYYDPTKRCSRTLGQRWITMFEEARAKFLKRIEDHIPGANKAVRLMRLERAVVHFERSGNYRAMAEMTERQAKEMGNVHSNRREFTGKDGGPIEYADMSDEQIDAELRQLLGLEDADGDGSELDPTRH